MATAAPEIPVLAREQAFESLYRSYVKDVYHYALALLRNPADAEDVTQTTFLNAYRAYSRGVEVEKPQNWLIKIAHNVARTRYARASRRVKEVPLEDHVEQLAVPEENRPDVHGVLQALGRLPFNQRAALVMRELEGRSYIEIADTIGVSVSAVETLIFRARRSLRLRASSLRSLAVVPLPSSLARFFETGGVVAGGGGAVAGAGFIAKATVALLAGAIATGIGSDRTRPATAAGDPTPRSAAAQSWTQAPEWLLVNPASARTAGHASATGTPISRTRQGNPFAAVPRTSSQGQASEQAQPASASSPLTAVTSQATSAASTVQQAVTSSAQQVVASVTVAVPLPAAPTLPSVPAELPEIPEIPGGTPLP
jgi:RNA polymerase sigma factor (sigma-70 family)